MRAAVLAFSTHNRRRKAELIGRFLTENQVRDAVFVGSGLGANRNEGIVEEAIARQVPTIAACDVHVTKVPWPFVLADGRALPFADDATDFVLSNAVIEHVGGLDDQRRFVAEHSRVGRTWVITTPNRWFPVESHTSAVLLHWLPSWRSRRREFTRLMSRREFRDLLPPGTRLVGRPWSATFVAFHVAAGPPG
jgi:hypothetical protein